MPLPNTLGIINEIQSMLTALTIYKTVEIGAVKDWTDSWPLAEVMFLEDDSRHFKMSGKIRDAQGFRITSAVNYTQQTPAQAVTQLIGIRDMVIPLFQQHAYLNGTAGVADSRVKEGSAKISFMLVNGDDYIVHEFIVEIKQDYNVPIGASGI